MNRTIVGLLLGLFPVLLVLSGCGDEETTARCPKAELYDVRDGGLSPELERRLVAAGCITAPVSPNADAGRE
ncbi:MAG: hypothetical protein JW751_15755 [Polyangiaceae bacterium]|nr:hypothetical protein [Polyangiaceae bacterium]